MESSINLNFFQLIQFIAIVLTGLLAGLFYGYNCSVIKGLGNLQDEFYLQSFQSINKAIQNPYFFLSFMGSFIVLPLATWLSSSNSTAISFYFFLSATCVYTIGVLGVTILGNVPLNEQLANLSIINASKTEVSQMRVLFENTWNKYHTIRTVAAIITFCLTILALIKNKI